MKPAPFAYARPGTVDDALNELSGAEDAKVLAGGQSLVPVLAMRLARPRTLVDITAIQGLDCVEKRNGTLRVGAAARQRAVEHHPVTATVPLLGHALPWVGHRELRSRGTVCGSLAHADPAAELPAVAVCLGATVEIAGPAGRRTIAAADLFTGPLTTVIAPDELLVSVSFPMARPGQGFGFAELARRHGDFALAGVAVRVDTPEDRRREETCTEVVCFGVSDTPVYRDLSGAFRSVLEDAGEDVPEGRMCAALADATDALAADVVNTVGDAHGSTGYRRRLVATLAAREISRAYVHARRTTPDREAR
jgi:carbon-monoxide dehydrogenase medium subunit